MGAAGRTTSAPRRATLPRRALWDYLQLTAGGAAMGLGISALIVPARIADGGLAGVSIIMHRVSGFGVGPLYLALNVPLLVWAGLAQGWRFVWRTLVGSVLVSAWATAFAPLHLPVSDRLLAALYGGLLVGVGIGLTLRVGGSTGGTDVVARQLSRRYGVSYTQTFLISDLVVLAAVALWMGLSAAMYAWIVSVVSGRVVSYVVEGPRRGRLAFVISTRQARICGRVLRELDRGATRLQASGGFTGVERPVLLIAVGPHQVVGLRHIVAEEDPEAFLVVAPAADVLGEGFWNLRPAEADAR